MGNVFLYSAHIIYLNCNFTVCSSIHVIRMNAHLYIHLNFGLVVTALGAFILLQVCFTPSRDGRTGRNQECLGLC